MKTLCRFFIRVHRVSVSCHGGKAYIVFFQKLLKVFRFLGMCQKIGGVNVPFDVSVMGFDDIPYGFMMTPSLTTIRQPAEETGRMATRLAVSLIGDPGSECMNEIFHPALIRRESVRRIGRIERKENSYND